MGSLRGAPPSPQVQAQVHRQVIEEVACAAGARVRSLHAVSREAAP